MTRETRIRFWFFGALIFFGALYLLRDVLTPFVAGMAISYLLDPLADRLERKGLSRLLATVIITVGFFLALAGLVAILVPLLQGQILDLVQNAPQYMHAVMDRAQPLLERLQAQLAPEDIAKLRDAAASYAGTAAGWAVGLLQKLLAGGLVFFHILSFLLITPVVTFYLIRDWDRLVARIDSWLPRDHAPTIRAQVRAIDQTIAAFLRGQATVCAVLAAYYGIALSLAGLDIGLLVGLVTGFLSFIPYVGALSGFSLAMGLALAQFDSWQPIALVGAVFAVGQVMEGNFLTPKLVGESIGLHPVWLIFALMAGGALVGFVGVLLAVPVAAVAGVLARFALGRYLEGALYHGGQPPTPET